MSSNVNAGASPASKLTTYVAVTTAMMEKAAAAEARAEKAAAAIQSMVPQLHDLLVAKGCLRADQREKLAALLQDPVETVKLLHRVADRIPNIDAQHTLGSPAGEKSGSDNQPYRGYSGEHTTRVKASDLAWFKGLGVPLPTK